MESEMVETAPDFALVEEHVALAECHVARQKEIVAEFRRAGHSTALAETLLAAFEQTLAMHLDHRDRMRAERAAAGKRGLILGARLTPPPKKKI